MNSAPPASTATTTMAIASGEDPARRAGDRRRPGRRASAGGSGGARTRRLGGGVADGVTGSSGASVRWSCVGSAAGRGGATGYTEPPEPPMSPDGPDGASASADQVRPHRHPRARGRRARRPAPRTSTTRSRASEPNWSGRTRKKSTMKPLTGSAAAARTPSVMSAPEQPDERALEHERPADERVRGADEPHDLDLLGPGDDGEPDRVDDDEQHDDPDDRAARPSRRCAGCS